MSGVVFLLNAFLACAVYLLPSVVGAIATRHGAGHSAFYDAWREGDSVFLRLGLTEVVVDLRR